MRTLSDLLAVLSDVEETPDGWLAACPAHADSHPSLRVTIGKDGSNVIVRDRAGCATADVMSALGYTMRDLAALTPGDDVPAAKRAVSTATPASPAAIASLAMQLDGHHSALTDPNNLDSPGALIYAEQRFGLSEGDAERLGLGYADDLGGGPRLVVPFRTPDGVARNFQARALDPDARVRWLGPKSPEGGSWSKLGFFPGTAGWSEVIVCEGPGDALTAAGLGYDAIGIAGAANAGNPAIVEEVAQWVGDREAVIAGDGDASGRRFSSQLSEGLRNLGVRVRVLDLADGLDLTDWREQSGPSQFQREVIRAIEKAREPSPLDAWDEQDYSYTDLGGARYLRDYIADQGSGVKFTAEAGFMLLDRGVWRVDDRQAVRTYAQKVADRAKALARQAAEQARTAGDGDPIKKRAAAFNRYAAHAQTSRGLDSMLRELQAVEGVPASINDFDQHPDLLAVANGVVNLRTGELQPHDASLLLSRRVSVPYDPAATAPRWEAFLRETFPGQPDMPGFMQRLTGYGITGHTSEQVFVIHLGKGANGKSVFTDTLTEVFREITTTTPFSTFEVKPSGGIPNDLAALKGARLVMASEGEAGKRMAEAVLKRVTGRDLIAARFMRQEFFEFRPTFLLQLATNFMPAFRGQDEGLWRRVKLVEWNRFFDKHERDPRLSEKLLAESAGILTWAVRGAQAWYRDRLDDPKPVAEATAEYRTTSDVLQGFLPGKYVYAEDDSKAVQGKTLWDDFRSWAEEENLRDLQGWSQRAFYSTLRERGLEQRRNSQGPAFYGVRRARRTDMEPDEATPLQDARAASDDPAVSLPTQTITGAALDDVL